MITTPSKILALALAAALAHVFAPAAPATATLPPIEAFFGTAQIAAPAVSPDGTRVAFIAQVAGRNAVVIFDLRDGKIAPVARAANGEVETFFWKGNDRLVFGIDADEGGWLVQALNLKTSERITLFGALVDRLPLDPLHVLVYWGGGLGVQPGLYLVSTVTGRPSGVFGGDPNTGSWAPDGAGHVRFRKRFAEGRMLLELRADNDALWETLATYPAALSAVYAPAQFRGFGSDPTVAYFSRNEEKGGGALFAVNTKTRQWGTPVVETNGDIVEVRLSPKHDRVEEIEYGPDAEQMWLDPHLGQLVAALRASFPAGYRIDLVSSDDAERVFAVAVSADVCPTVFYLLDTRGKMQLVELGKTHPQLNPNQLQPMRRISYSARDGLTIHGYLTLPAVAPQGGRVPLIVLPHSWPFGDHDQWGFDPSAQFLASRGYAVLQPNYRGSGGYGVSFVLAGRSQMGRKMQDDLTDAVTWAIDKGIADPRRIAIYGAGYGGYAALIGAAYTPDLYRCAINFSGPTNLRLVTGWQNRESEAGRAFVEDMIGDDDAFVHAYSPVNLVERIQIPTLHAYAEREQWIKPQSWSELERELKKYRKTYEYVSEGKGRIGFRSEESVMRFYKTLEAFLAKYLMPETRFTTAQPSGSLSAVAPGEGGRLGEGGRRGEGG